jgi:hypothetical protein
MNEQIAKLNVVIAELNLVNGKTGKQCPARQSRQPAGPGEGGSGRSHPEYYRSESNDGRHQLAAERSLDRLLEERVRP